MYTEFQCTYAAERIQQTISWSGYCLLLFALASDQQGIWCFGVPLEGSDTIESPPMVQYYISVPMIDVQRVLWQPHVFYYRCHS